MAPPVLLRVRLAQLPGGGGRTVEPDAEPRALAIAMITAVPPAINAPPAVHDRTLESFFSCRSRISPVATLTSSPFHWDCPASRLLTDSRAIESWPGSDPRTTPSKLSTYGPTACSTDLVPASVSVTFTAVPTLTSVIGTCLYVKHPVPITTVATTKARRINEAPEQLGRVNLRHPARRVPFMVPRPGSTGGIRPVPNGGFDGIPRCGDRAFATLPLGPRPRQRVETTPPNLSGRTAPPKYQAVTERPRPPQIPASSDAT